MKNKSKKAAKRAFRVPPLLIAIAVLAVLVVVPWLLLAPDSSKPEMGRSLPTEPVWTPLVSQEYGFRVSLPAPAKNMSPGGGLGLGGMWAAMYTGGTFMVQVSRCPEKLCTQAPESVLEGASKGALEGVGGTMLSEKKLQLPCPDGTCSGLDFEATAPQGLRISGRLFITHDKIFQLLGTQASGSDEVFRKVVDSFSFL